MICVGVLEYNTYCRADWSIIIKLRQTKRNQVIYDINGHFLDRCMDIRYITNNNTKNFLSI